MPYLIVCSCGSVFDGERALVAETYRTAHAEPFEQFEPGQHTPRLAGTLAPDHLCLRCGHTWAGRSASRPKQCPNCHSPYWDRPRQREEVSDAQPPR